MKLLFRFATVLGVALSISAEARERFGDTDSIFPATGLVGTQSGPADPSVKQACDTAFVQRLMLAAAYGSCEAPMAAKGGGVPADSVCQSMPPKNPGTLAQVWNSKGECPKGSPKKPSYSQSGARMKVTGKVIDPVPGGTTDCSGAWSGVEARLGHRLFPGKELNQPTTTAELVQVIGNGKSCYDEVKDGLLPGDTVVWNDGKKGHVIKIDRISAGGPGSCEFSYFESSGGKDSQYGGPRIVVKGGESGGGAISDAMGTAVNRLSKSCVARSGKKNLKVGRFNPNKPGCKGEPKNFKNEGCAKTCPNLGIKSAEVGA